MALDWSQCPAVERIPGMTIEDLMDHYPVAREKVKAVLEFAARSLHAPAGHT
jgi:uncharacterized protein (DUF433 family)